MVICLSWAAAVADRPPVLALAVPLIFPQSPILMVQSLPTWTVRPLPSSYLHCTALDCTGRPFAAKQQCSGHLFNLLLRKSVFCCVSISIAVLSSQLLSLFVFKEPERSEWGQEGQMSPFATYVFYVREEKKEQRQNKDINSGVLSYIC